jgi:hypothetical protein
LPEDSIYLSELVEDYIGNFNHRRDDISDDNYHSHSYLTLRELIEFDYDKTFWNRRITFTGASLAKEGEGTIISYRENLGEFFFTHLEELKQLGDLDDVRIVFWFDN